MLVVSSVDNYCQGLIPYLPHLDPTTEGDMGPSVSILYIRILSFNQRYLEPQIEEPFLNRRKNTYKARPMVLGNLRG